MNPVMDFIMLILFLLFMVFIFGGYHRSKFIEREAQKKRKDESADAEEPIK